MEGKHHFKFLSFLSCLLRNWNMITLIVQVVLTAVSLPIIHVLYGFVHRYRRSLKFLQGPTPESMLFGNIALLNTVARTDI